jgi:dihydroneopterin aldolase
MYKIIVEDLSLKGFHGVFKEEKLIGNTFIFNLEVQLPWEESLENDSLDESIDYSKLIEIIIEENSLPSNLLENLAHRIVKRIYKEFGAELKVKLRLAKKTPPLKADLKSISVEIEQ